LTLERHGDGTVVIEAEGKSTIRIESLNVVLRGLTLRQQGLGELNVVHLNNGQAILEDCNLSAQKAKGQHAILLQGVTSKVTVRRCELSAADIGLSVEAGAAVLEETDVFGMKRCGVWIRSELGESTLRMGSVIRDNGQSGILVEDGATLNVEGCSVRTNRWYGFLIRKGGTCRLTDTAAIENHRDGMLVQTGGTTHLERCHVERNRMAGVAVVTKGQATIADSVCNNNVNGLYVSALGTVDAKTSDFDNNRGSGISVNTDASATARDCNARGNLHGITIGPGSELRTSGLTLALNQESDKKVHVDGRHIEE
jgi:hypothetical protein